MYEKPEKKDVMGNINYNGKYILTKDMGRNQKPARATKSVPAAEIVTAVEACDEGHWVRHILDQVLGVTLYKFPLPAITDSESLSAVSKITNNIQDTRSRIEAAQPREGLELNELERLWVPGGKQVADILTKEVSSNQVERMKTRKDFGGRIRSSSPKDLKPCKDFYYQYSTSEGQF